MGRALAITAHAIDRFQQRWRPTLSREEAALELEVLVAEATPTRELSIARDARIYKAQVLEETIRLAVRDEVVITVLAKDDAGGGVLDMTPDPVALDESADDVATGRALAGPASAADREREYQLALDQRSRKASAERVVREYRNGSKVRRSVLMTACQLLEIEVPELRPIAGTLRIDGGKYDGVRVEISFGEAPEPIAERLLIAMRAR